MGGSKLIMWNLKLIYSRKREREEREGEGGEGGREGDRERER